MGRQKTLKLGAAAFAALGVVGPAFAQDTTVGSETSVSDVIVVTARRREENLQDVPISITTVDQEALENQSVHELIDLQQQVPGMQINVGTASALSQVITIRGQGQADTLLTTDGSVGVYVDGVINPRSVGLSSILQDVRRVEVLRGPQGTLFGRNTTGGAVSIVTNEATPEFGASLRTIAGDYGAIDVSGVLNLPLGDDAGLRIFARRSTRDGFAADAAGRDLNDEELSYVRARMDVDPSDNVSITLSADYGRNDTGGAAIQLAGFQFAGNAHVEIAAQTCGCLPGLPQLLAVVPLINSWIVSDGLDRSFLGQQQLSQAESWSAAADVSIDLSNGLTFRSISGYRELQRHDVEDLDGTPVLVLQSDLHTRFSFFSQEFQLLGGTDTFQWVLGAYASDEEGNDGSVSRALPFLNPANPSTNDADVTNSSIALFGQASWEFAPRWSLTAGARWTEETKEMVSRNHRIIVPFQEQPPIATATGHCRIDPAQLDNPAICQASFSDEFSGWSWLASVDYDLTDNVLLYVSASEGFRGGGQNLRGAPASGSFDAYEPETARNYELGLKSVIFDGHLRLNTAVFMTDYRDIQRTVIVAGLPPATRTGNAAVATLTGGEVEAAWNPIDPLTLSVTAAYLNGEYDEYINIGDGLNHVNDPWPAPEWTYSASARYVVPLSIGDLAVQLDYSHADGFSGASVATHPSLVPFLAGTDTDLVNGRISLDIDSMNAQVAIFGRNLADADYYTSRLPILGVVTRYAGYPRFIGAEFRIRLGDEAS
ncbi:MAG: TonB-dependent receptor [Caulobacteraceae bacterium]